jgi:hypothetical protein
MTYLIHPILNESESKSNPKLLRIHLDKSFTRLDFGYATHSYYVKGGWFNISPKTFLKVNDKEEIFKLLRAEGITYAPKKHFFESNKDWAFFSLYFEAIPMKSCSIDMIESKKPTFNNFNYYGIQIELEDRIEVIEL